MVTYPTTQVIEPLVLHLGPYSQRMDDDQYFFEFCQLNPELRIERSCKGDLIIMPPTGGSTGIINSDSLGILYNWKEKDGTGLIFDSSTGFTLPNGAKRSPDLSWVKKDRWNLLTQKEQDKFPPICPDFVAEIRSVTDDLNTLKNKMVEYIENGARLGWLIDPVDGQVLIYRPNCDVETIRTHAVIKGDPVLPGFELDTRKLW